MLLRHTQSKQTGRLFSQNLCGIPLWLVPARFFHCRKLKPQSKKSHRAMQGSSPCGLQNATHISFYIPIYFKWTTFTREFDTNFLCMMLSYLPRLTDILWEAILKRTSNKQDTQMKLTKKQHNVFEGLKPCTDIHELHKANPRAYAQLYGIIQS